MFDYWTTPPVDIIIKIYVFNYSNIFEFENGIEKRLRLDEVGPYVYRERTVKTGMKFDGDKITFSVG
jgi:scavenger receptor class B, member 1